MSILLIRHGETASNRGRVLQTPDVPLNERGIAQARCLAERLCSWGVHRILSSDHARAAMTAEAIAAACGVAVETDIGLQERNFGELRGRPYAEIEGDLFAADFEPPGGETWDAFNRRVDSTWARITAAPPRVDEHLVLVTHGLFCRSLVERRLALASGMLAPRVFHNASLTVIGPCDPWLVELLNCCAHLEQESSQARLGGAV